MRTALLISLLAAPTALAAPQTDWWDTDWEYRQKLVLDTSGNPLGGALTNFPVLVKLGEDTNGNGTISIAESRVDWGRIEDDASDVRFVLTTSNTDHTVLPYEIEIYDEATRVGVFHVRIPSVPSSGQVEIWMYYGNAAATAPTNDTQVWSNSFEAVWHVDNNFNLLNSTSNSGRDRVAAGTPTKGLSDRGYWVYLDSCNWNGSSCDWVYEYYGASNSWDAGAVLGKANYASLSFWMNTNIKSYEPEYQYSRGIMGKQVSGHDDHFWGWLTNDSGVIGLEIPSSGTWSVYGAQTTDDVTDSTWHHVFMQRNKSTGYTEIYLDGALQDTATQDSGDTNAAVRYVGHIESSGDAYHGHLDEIRVASAWRDAAWAKAEYLSFEDAFWDYDDGVTYYPDTDGDGYGDSTGGIVGVEPYGYVTDNTDCDDTSNLVYPGAPELCNGASEDCDANIDEGAAGEFYQDLDDDGIGSAITVVAADCENPGQYESPITGDCDDNDPNVGGPTTWWYDQDGDGVGISSTTEQACSPSSNYVAPSADQDCAPNDGAIFPGAQEVCDPGDIDEDCDGSADDADDDARGGTNWYLDGDGDGYGGGIPTISCDPPTADHIADNTDCNDNDANEFPGQQWYLDSDGDGYGTGSPTVSCTRPNGYVLNADDCDDANAAVNPDKQWYPDRDGDTYGDFAGARSSCLNPDSDPNDGWTYVENGDDCNDDDNTDRPDTEYWPDDDNDGFGDANRPRLGCGEAPTGFVLAGVDDPDCDDTLSEIFPGAPDPCDNVDEDCDGDGGPTHDLDGDGLTWEFETSIGMNGCSEDTDGDTVLDSVEYFAGDSDSDGIIDPVDGDDDGDGVPTSLEDYCLSGCPSDPFSPGNGVVDDFDDSDGDGTPDYLDIDDDNDGIFTKDEDRDGNLDPRDDDTDNDRIPDFIDVDDDGDGIRTEYELPHGSHYMLDADGDFIDDRYEWYVNANGVNEPSVEQLDRAQPADTDNDNIPDIIDGDDDGDGVYTADEGLIIECGSFTNDNIPGYLDDDTDGDGRLDSVEGYADLDGNTQPDYNDCLEESGPESDRDGDGLTNGEERTLPGCLSEFDADSDDDGIPDGVEIGNLANPRNFDLAQEIQNGDQPRLDACDPDDDGDGAMTSEEIKVCTRDSATREWTCVAPATPPAVWADLADIDGDGSPNHHDVNDDDDRWPTPVEGAELDQDFDGLLDFLDADHTDGPCGDADGDGIPTYVEETVYFTDPEDEDMDNDRIIDGAELGAALPWPTEPATDCRDIGINWPTPRDYDGDQTADMFDEDDDNDGVPTVEEGSWDIDGDGIPSHLDDDADGDGILDADEGTGDDDGDGLPNFIDPDNNDLLGAFDSFADTNAPVEPCGCQSTGSVGWTLMLLPLALLRRRRVA
ncbi:MAG: DUF2341 domain-containing protein [Deltaproteobacteria bacterium]|nr:MAG: DUF2341 domain-containing protein [Deltaproteobacteria bacterium]